MGFEFFKAFSILKLTSLQKSLAAGTAKENETIFPANLCRLLAEMTFDSIKESLRVANFNFYLQVKEKLAWLNQKGNPRRVLPELAIR